MKKTFFLLLFFSIVFSCHASVANVTFNGIKYEIVYYTSSGIAHICVVGCDKGLKEIEIPDKITYSTFPASPVNYIDVNAFLNNTELETVTINGTELTTIGGSAFEGCINLKSINIPEGVTNIAREAFKNCSKLKYVQLPQSLTELGWNVFTGCSSMQSIYIPPKITSIGNGSGTSPFPDSLKKIAYSQGTGGSLPSKSTKVIEYPSGSISTSDGCVYSEDMKTLYYAPSILEEIEIDSRTTTIDAYSLSYCESMKEVSLPVNLSRIGEQCFYNCIALEEVVIPGSVQDIGKDAFGECTDLRNVVFTRNASGGAANQINIITPFTNSGVQTFSVGRDVIGQYGFGRSLQEVTVTASVNTIGETAFKDCKGLTSVTLNLGNLTSIDKSAFEGCIRLPQITIPDNVETIGEKIFEGCSSLQDVSLSSIIIEIPDNAFKECINLTTVTIPNGVTSIGTSAFENCSVLPTINIPQGIKQLAASTFAGCAKLNDISWPEGLTSIGNNAFSGCSSLTQIGLSNVETLGTNAFQNCSSLKEVVFGENLSSIPDYCFDGCSQLLDVQLPDNITTIGSYAFNGNSSMATVKLPESLTAINAYAFNGCTPLTEISFPAQVKDIYKYAFSGCDNITKVYSLNNTPPTCADKTVFSDQVYNNAALYVPTEFLEDYQYYNVWKEFFAKEGLTEVTKIEISSVSEKSRVRVNKTLELKATVSPVNATFPNVEWSSNNPSVATVQDGIVQAVSPGYAVITAKATDMTALTGTFEVEVIDFLLGDSNESDDVTITDAVNIASYVLDKNPQPFSFDSSDVNEDDNITFSDASGVITIILDDASAAPASYGMTRTADNLTDRLAVADKSFAESYPLELPVTLKSTREFVALQTEITATNGLTIEEVVPSVNVAATHMVTVKRLSEDKVRLILFSPAMNVLPADSEPLFNLVVGGNPYDNANIMLANVLATTSELEEYELGYEGGNIEVATTGAAGLQNEDIKVSADSQGVSISNAAGTAIRIYNINGMLMNAVDSADHSEHFELMPGIYIVTVNEKSFKISVK